jgi:hypothetical protein
MVRYLNAHLVRFTFAIKAANSRLPTPVELATNRKKTRSRGRVKVPVKGVTTVTARFIIFRPARAHDSRKQTYFGHDTNVITSVGTHDQLDELDAP